MTDRKQTTSGKTFKLINSQSGGRYDILRTSRVLQAFISNNSQCNASINKCEPPLSAYIPVVDIGNELTAGGCDDGVTRITSLSLRLKLLFTNECAE